MHYTPRVRSLHATNNNMEHKHKHNQVNWAAIKVCGILYLDKKYYKKNFNMFSNIV